MPGRMILAAEFTERMRSEADDFLDFWTKEREKNPGQFPERMAEGDWFEQYLAWSSCSKERL